MRYRHHDSWSWTSMNPRLTPFGEEPIAELLWSDNGEAPLCTGGDEAIHDEAPQCGADHLCYPAGESKAAAGLTDTVIHNTLILLSDHQKRAFCRDGRSSSRARYG